MVDPARMFVFMWMLSWFHFVRVDVFTPELIRVSIFRVDVYTIHFGRFDVFIVNLAIVFVFMWLFS